MASREVAGLSTRTRPEAAVGIATATVSFLVFASRTCPNVVFIGDSGELITGAATLGVPHAPGYPLQVLLSQPFLGLSWLELPFRVNLMSAVCQALTVGVVAFTSMRTTRSAVAALCSAGFLMFTRSFLRASLYAEVFPLNDLFFALLIALAVEARRRVDEERDPAALLVASSALAGIASTQHQTIALAAPALLVWMGAAAARRIRTRASLLVAMLAAFMLPFVVIYAVVPVLAAREPYLSWGDVRSLRALVNLVTRADYGGLLRASKTEHPGPVMARVSTFATLTWTSVGLQGVLLGALGAARTLRQSSRHALALGLAFVFPGPVFAAMNPLFAEPATSATAALAERFIPMCHVPLALLAGEAAAGAAAVARTRLVWALPVLVAGIGFFRSRDVTLLQDVRGKALVADLLSHTPDDAVVMLRGDVWASAADYLCGVEKTCGHRVILFPGMLHLAWYRAQLARRHPQLPVTGITTIRETHRIVERIGREHPVYVQPVILGRDPGLAAFPMLPSGLLLRLYPDAPSRAAESGAFRARSEALASGRDCEGCSLRRSELERPSFEEEIDLAYRASLENHASFAREFLGDGALSARLAARAAQMDL